MKTVFVGIVQVILASGILYGYYHLFLRNKKFHQYNRFYLLTATVISLLIPFLSIPVYFTQKEGETSFVLQTLSAFSYPATFENIAGKAVPSSSSPGLTGVELLYYGYLLIVFLFFARIIFSLIKIRRIAAKNPVERLANVNFVITAEPSAPFSFFHWLFWHKDTDLNSSKGEQIFRHELFHIRQKHSLDVIFMELVTTLCWINPFFHLIKKEIVTIHEFLADRFAVRKNQELDYAELLLMQALRTSQPLVNPFFHIQIKRRIAMITSSQKSKYQYARKILVLPLLAIIAALFAFTYKEIHQQPASLDKVQELRPIVLDQQPLKDTPKTKPQPVFDVHAKKVTVTKNDGKVSEPELYIINSKTYTLEEIKKLYPDAKIVADEIITTAPNDPQAIKLYGEKARNGVVELKNVTIIYNTPERVKGINIQPLSERPLFVVDGEVQEKDSDILQTLQPSEIESVTVLKDKSSIEMYGEAGKNGVIIIRRKK